MGSPRSPPTPVDSTPRVAIRPASSSGADERRRGHRIPCGPEIRVMTLLRRPFCTAAHRFTNPTEFRQHLNLCRISRLAPNVRHLKESLSGHAAANECLNGLV